jgi:hypothetical protein
MPTPLEQIRAAKLARAKRLTAGTPEKQETNAAKGGLATAGIFVSGIIVLLFALGSDILDYFVIGSIPVLGDILDMTVWLTIAAWVWFLNMEKPLYLLFAGLIELIPFIGDFVPTWTIMVLIIIFYNLGGKKIIKIVSPV